MLEAQVAYVINKSRINNKVLHLVMSVFCNSYPLRSLEGIQLRSVTRGVFNNAVVKRFDCCRIFDNREEDIPVPLNCRARYQQIYDKRHDKYD